MNSAILAVGCGGGVGVFMGTKVIPSGSDTITITVGNGQTNTYRVVGGYGNTTYVSLTKNTSLNVIRLTVNVQTYILQSNSILFSRH